MVFSDTFYLMLHHIWRKVNSGFIWKEKNEFEDILWIVTLNLVDLLYIFLTTLGEYHFFVHQFGI